MRDEQRRSRKTTRRTPEDAAPRESNRVRVHALLRSRITSLELPPGTPLSENELAAELDVSRTPVREALILLGEESLVDIFPKLGTFVSRISVDAVLEAQFMREALELAALREAVKLAEDEDIAALRAILDAQRAAFEAADDDLFFEQDEAFHRRLMEASGHRTLWRTVTTAKAHLDRARRLSLPLPHRIEHLIGEHREVVDALELRDAARAEQALRGHLQGVFDDIGTIQAERPELFVAPSELPPPSRPRSHPGLRP
ncbi:GntR family transcriptional regulator [Streptomyces endophyticus]|uniref:GntR family transcriptional regulator n=1 Tax=Streptomyces endophyticus TaxID=714166 RepID=A0ABU6FI44_9ACTN|nr:GntR family transcriptional regulator [Streptomyces endophyticus]MEB8342447.1 GntR family transcriptional regulator [Streptomyces endophyticus]